MARPDRWRDVQNVAADIGHHIVSDRPMTEAEWIEQRTKVIEAKADERTSPQVTQDGDDQAKPLD